MGITQIRLLNELYFALGQLRAQGMELDVKQAIQDLRDIWNRFIDGTQRPDILQVPDEGSDSSCNDSWLTNILIPSSTFSHPKNIRPSHFQALIDQKEAGRLSG